MKKSVTLVFILLFSQVFFGCGQAFPDIGKFIDEQLALMRDPQVVPPPILVKEFFLYKTPVIETLIDNTEKTITVILPCEYDLSAINFNVVHTGVGYSPQGTVNLGSPLAVTITDSDGNTETYTVNTFFDTSGTYVTCKYIQVMPQYTDFINICFDVADTGLTNFKSMEFKGQVEITSIGSGQNYNFYFGMSDNPACIFGVYSGNSAGTVPDYNLDNLLFTYDEHPQYFSGNIQGFTNTEFKGVCATQIVFILAYEVLND